MEEISTFTRPTRLVPARFPSAIAHQQWLAGNPTFRDVGKLAVQRRFAGEVCTLLAEYATPEQCAKAKREADDLDRDSRNRYQRVKRTAAAPVTLTYAELRAERDARRNAEAKEAGRKARLRDVWAKLAETPAGRAQLADWRAEAIASGLADVPPEVESVV